VDKREQQNKAEMWPGVASKLDIVRTPRECGRELHNLGPVALMDSVRGKEKRDNVLNQYKRTVEQAGVQSEREATKIRHIATKLEV